MADTIQQYRLFKDLDTNEVYKVPNKDLSIERLEGTYDLKYRYKVSDDYTTTNLGINYNNKSQMVRVRKRFVYDTDGCLTSLVKNVSTNSDILEFGLMFRNLEYSSSIPDVNRVIFKTKGVILDELPNIYGGGAVCWGNYSLPRDRDVRLSSNYYFNMGFNNDLCNRLTITGGLYDLVERQIVLRHGREAFNKIKNDFEIRGEKALGFSSLQILLVAHISGVYVDDLLKMRRVE